MFLGHFALAAASKPVAPVVPVWALMVSAQALDVVFIPMVALGLESITMSGYGTATINAYYTHSIVGALAISAAVFFISLAIWKSQRVAWVLALLAASHWVLDFVVHRQDMPIFPGNWGGFPLLGLGLWNYPWISLTIEIIMAIVGLVIYFRYARQRSEVDSRWYWGPVITAIFFVLLVAMDLSSMPPLS